MGIKPKTFQEIMQDMVSSSLTTSKIEDLHAGSVIKSLLKSIEEDMYIGSCPPHERGLRKLLQKFGIKSAKWEGGLTYGMPLQMESLEATLNKVTFDDKKLKLWKP